MVSIQTKKTKRVSVTVASLILLILFCVTIVPLLHITLSSQTTVETVAAVNNYDSKSSSSVRSLTPQSCCNEAKSESLSFFTDIPNEEWRIKKGIYKSTQPNYTTKRKDLRLQMQNPQEFWNSNFEPEFTCGLQRRLGGDPPLGDGGKWVCDAHRIGSSSSDGKCLVYSIGSNGNAMFEKAMHETLSQNNNCKEVEIHTFDLKGWNKRNGKFSDRVGEAGGAFHEWGITVDTMNFTREEYFLPKVYRGLTFKSFQQTFEELGHMGRVVDVMKIDCEGCEWQSVNGWLKDWKDSGVLVRQLLLEIHDSPSTAVDFFMTLKEAGYVIFHKEVTGSCAEYAFVKMDPTFF